MLNDPYDKALENKILADYMGVSLLGADRAASLFRVFRNELCIEEEDPLLWTRFHQVVMESDETSVGWSVQTPYINIVVIRCADAPQGLMVMRRRSERLSPAIAALLSGVETT